MPSQEPTRTVECSGFKYVINPVEPISGTTFEATPQEILTSVIKCTPGTSLISAETCSAFSLLQGDRSLAVQIAAKDAAAVAELERVVAMYKGEVKAEEGSNILAQVTFPGFLGICRTYLASEVTVMSESSGQASPADSPQKT